MAIKGLSIPVFGEYNHSNGVVTYANGMINPHAVSYSIAVEASEDNPLYADNRIVESDTRRFNSGTLTLETDDLAQDISKFLLGVKEIERTYGEAKTVRALIYDDEQRAPYLGFGIIEEHQNNNIDQYKAVILKKVAFNIPEDAATTRGESVDWQTRTIEGTIERSEENGETGVYPWKEEAWFNSESEALLYLKSMLGVVEKGV